jgi:alkaline phosphatase D
VRDLSRTLPHFHSLYGLRRCRAAAAGLTLEACATTPVASGAAADPRTLTRIAFGSCAKSDKPQPIWDAVLAAEPELFIFLGDNVYLDTRDTAVMDRKYAELAAQAGFQKLKASTPIVAIWDDHDFGENDAGADYPMKEESRKRLLDFFGEPEGSVRRTRSDGIYTSYLFGPAGRRVQILLPDLRWNRTPIYPIELGGKDYEEWATEQHEAGKPVPGPYARNPEIPATMLGETQWTWLENELARPADLRILGSSLQVIADFPGWEGWIVFAQDHQRLMQAIRDKRANHLVCISGDTHYGEVSLLDVNVPYPIWDVTSSGLTEVWPVLPPNARRVGEAYRAENFGLIEIDWAAGAVVMQVRGVDGAVQLEQRVTLADLVVG